MGLRFASCAALVIAVSVPIAAEAQHNSAITISAGVIDGEVSHWTLLRRIEHGPHDITGPAGRLGSVTGTLIEDSHHLWSFSANVLMKSTGRVRAFAGVGGPVNRRHHVLAAEPRCSPSLDPRTCERFENAPREDRSY